MTWEHPLKELQDIMNKILQKSEVWTLLGRKCSSEGCELSEVLHIVYCKNITIHRTTKATGAGSVENTEKITFGEACKCNRSSPPQLHLHASAEDTRLVRHQERLCEPRKSTPCFLEPELSQQSALIWYWQTECWQYCLEAYSNGSYSNPTRSNFGPSPQIQITLLLRKPATDSLH